MSRSFFAPDSKAPASPSESSRAPFLTNASNGSPGIGSPKEDNTMPAYQKPVVSVSALAPILSYCAASLTMTVTNKSVLKTHFSLNLVVLLIQSIVGCAIVVSAHYLRYIELRQLKVNELLNWLPVSTALVFVIWTGSKALQFLSMPVYTIFKNLTIILIAYGEVIWFKGRITRLTMISFLLMVLSSVIAAYSDLSQYMALDSLSMPHTPDSLNGGSVDPDSLIKTPAFDVLGDEKANILALEKAQGGTDQVLDLAGYSILNSGYMWMALNCACSAGFVLGMRGRMKSAKMNDMDTVFFNNFLTIPVLLVMSLLVEDWSQANFQSNFPLQGRTVLLMKIVFSGACAVLISYTTAWCIRATSSTTYSMVGALNKLPLALSGIVVFGDPATPSSLGAIAVGGVSGLVYAVAKNKQSEEDKRLQASAATGEAASKGSPDRRAEGIIPMHHMNGKEQRND